MGLGWVLLSGLATVALILGAFALVVWYTYYVACSLVNYPTHTLSRYGISSGHKLAMRWAVSMFKVRVVVDKKGLYTVECKTFLTKWTVFRSISTQLNAGPGSLALADEVADDLIKRAHTWLVESKSPYSSTVKVLSVSSRKGDTQ